MSLKRARVCVWQGSGSGADWEIRKGGQAWEKQPTFGSIRGVLIHDAGWGSEFGKILENDLPNGEKSHISDDLDQLT